MNYQETLNYLYDRLPIFQRVGAAALKKDLTNTLKILEVLDNPHQSFKSIHIAGTNGKGTSAHALASILQSAGYKTGLYTSPHLKSFTERIRVNGEEVSESYVVDFVRQYRESIEEIAPSFFEVTVGMAFDYFRAQNVEIAIVETGLGGRLDSTNVITPEVCLITMIGWDHADLLGTTLQDIAGEKAGIAKQGVPMVIGANQPEIYPVFEGKAEQVGTSLVNANHYHVELTATHPKYQEFNVYKGEQLVLENIQTDITAAYFLNNIPGILTTIDQLVEKEWKIDFKHIVEGLSSIKAQSGLKGRWQVLGEKPLIVADLSHNEPGLQSLFKQVREMSFPGIHLIFGVVKDKDLSKIMTLLPKKQVNYYFTQSSVPRSLSSSELHQKAQDHGLHGKAFENVNLAINEAKMHANYDDLILICGSTFVVAEIDEL